jgi:hypothetical protein
MDQRFDLHSQPGSDERLKALIEHFAGDAHCPLCGEPYAREEIRVLRQQEHRWTVSVQCLCCGSGSLITAMLPDSDHVEALRSQCCSHELTPGEARWFASVAPLTSQDVLDWRVYLQHFHGDFAGLD